MADITVRRMRFPFDEPIDLDLPDREFASAVSALALSLTMPYLEPYLIRTMKVAIGKITDPALKEDVRRFSQQEGHHFRNHADLNDRVRASFDAGTADAIRGIERDLDADYHRFTKQKSLRFNAAYAEGFEAMTCAWAVSMAEHMGSMPPLPGGEIWGWHMAEEIEHRTVAFDVFHHLVGSYLYRIVFGTWAQWHYLSYIRRFALCMAGALGRKLVAPDSPAERAALRRFLRTFRPSYDPAQMDVPPVVDELLARYTAMAEAPRGGEPARA